MMPDDSIACILGRLEESINNIKADLEELKTEHKEITSFINQQRVAFRYGWFILSFIGAAIFFFKDVISLFFQYQSVTKTH